MSHFHNAYRAIALAFLITFAMVVHTSAAGRPHSMTSHDLIEQNPEAWKPVDATTRTGLLADRRSGWERASIIDFLEDEATQWSLHHGDLTLPGTLNNAHALVVTGNLTIDGSYNDDTDDGIGQLIVLGNLVVDHVVSWGGLHVEGDLRATGVVYAYYNDFTFEVTGTLVTRLMVVDDKSSEWGSLVAEALLNAREEIPEEIIAKSIRMLHPALIDFGRLGEGELHELWTSYDRMQEHVENGEPLFRDPPAGTELIEQIELLLDSNTTRQQAGAVLFEDPLLTHLAAYWRDDLTRETVEAMIAMGNPLVLRTLAFDNHSVPKRLRKRAQTALGALP